MIRGHYYLVARHASDEDSVGVKGTLIRNKANSPFVERLDATVVNDPALRAQALAAFKARLDASKDQLIGYDSTDSVEILPTPDLGDTRLADIFLETGAEMEHVELTDVTPPAEMLAAAHKVVVEYYEGRAMTVESDNRVNRIKAIRKELNDSSMTDKEIWTNLMVEDEKVKATVLLGDYKWVENAFKNLGTSIAETIKKRST
jgi:hypothetical protein